ncbi:MAG: hypothetical protein C5B47_08820 [Verrucomicrobia bacterium]|nr:MAG: hypothetical protein C5B47_08820 [Verrucomicrobiota bacterium]
MLGANIPAEEAARWETIRRLPEQQNYPFRASSYSNSVDSPRLFGRANYKLGKPAGIQLIAIN